MNSGALRHLVTLDTPNGPNGYTPLNPAIWACAQTSQGADQGMLLTGRYHPGINTATRVTFDDGRIFHVDSVINRDERDVELAVVCREVFT